MHSVASRQPMGNVGLVIAKEVMVSRKRAGYTSAYLPPEILWACGLTPVRLRPGAGLAAADGYLPRNFSVEARGLLAAALAGDLAIDAVIFLDEEETSRRMFDVWQAYTRIPAVGLVSLPRLEGDAASRRYAQALTELAASATALSGQALTADGLAQALDLYNDQRALWRALQGHWVAGRLGARDWYDLRWLALTSEPAAANQELADTLQRIDGDQTPPQSVPTVGAGAAEDPRRSE